MPMNCPSGGVRGTREAVERRFARCAVRCTVHGGLVETGGLVDWWTNKH